jgi:hypothetical protein
MPESLAVSMSKVGRLLWPEVRKSLGSENRCSTESLDSRSGTKKVQELHNTWDNVMVSRKRMKFL